MKLPGIHLHVVFTVTIKIKGTKVEHILVITT